jgi:type II secretory pathway pseudopilin PulG
VVTGTGSLRGVGPRTQGGFTYLWVLVAIAVLGIGLLAVSEVWVTSARRQKLVELQWIGAQFTQAIGSYYQSTPGAAKVYPKTLQDLIEDRRYVTVRRHLRTVYANPFTGKPDWELMVSGDGRVRGVRVNVPGEDGAGVREFAYQPGQVSK